MEERRRELVVLSGFLTNELTRGYEDFEYEVVHAVNGEPIADLAHLSSLLDSGNSKLVTIMLERNGIMLVSHIRHLLEEEGETSFRRAVVQGARERLVPILMTALATGLALVPLALAGSHPGAELEAPMAVVIVFGLFSATALNMMVVPIAYFRFGRAKSST